MKIFVIGLSHKSAPVSIRDRAAIDSGKLISKLDGLKSFELLKESVVLSTCNRTELYGLMPKKCEGSSAPASFFNSMYEGMDLVLEDYLYCHFNYEAVRHILRVSSGLDSLALGEPQVFGQIKDAYKAASQNNNTGPVLNRLLHKTFEVTKQIRTETRIGEGTTSIGFSAVDLAQKIFGDLSPLKIMVVGAGETGTLTAGHFQKRGVSKFLIANRTFEKAEKLAAFLQGSAIRFNSIDLHLAEVDAVVTCVGAEDMIITRKAVEEAMKRRKNRQLFFIDLGAPRDVEPSVKELYNVFSFNIDDLKEVVESNIALRKNETNAAEGIIEREVKSFFEWYGTIEVVPVIQQLQQYFESVRQNEIRTNLKKLNDNNIDQIELLTKSIVKKLLKVPILHLKEKASTEEGVSHAEALKKIFNLRDSNRPEDTTE
ncbi:glutamyl-tRNA reductase [candidate division KSB1 bacterium]